jgi:hypothetical protein
MIAPTLDHGAPGPSPAIRVREWTSACGPATLLPVPPRSRYP